MSPELQLLIGVLSLASAVLGLYASLRQVKASRIPSGPPNDPAVPRRDQRSSSEGALPAKWYDHPGWILFWLVTFWPVGLFALARGRLIRTSWGKAVLAGLGVLMMLIMLGA